MNIFVVQHIVGNNNLGAYASDVPMEEFLSRWKKETNSSRMSISQTMEFINFMDTQKDAIKIDEINVFAFGYLSVWKDD